jgi:hypothetical protein
VALGLSALAAGVILELPLGRVERVANGHEHVFVRVMLRRLAADHELATGHGEIDADAVQSPLVVMPVGCLDYHPAAHDAVVELVELGCLLADTRLDGRRPWHVPKRDL